MLYQFYPVLLMSVLIDKSSVIGVSIYRLTLLFLYSPENVSGKCLSHPLNEGPLINRLNIATVAPSTIWSVIECAVAIICACLPTLMPLVRLIWSCCHCSRQSCDRELEGQDLVHSPISDSQGHRNGRAVALNRKNAANGLMAASGNVVASGRGSDDSAGRGMVSVEQVSV